MSNLYPQVRKGPVRIGDAERDQAVSALGEHFAAGRLTREEFDERSDQAVRARYAADLAPLFDDLPAPEPAMPPRMVRRPGPPPFFLLAPVLMVALVITAILATAPWLLWIFFWIALFSGPWGRRWHSRQWQHRGGPYRR
jgi:Domain of unknown function (DUF1707)